VEGKDGRCSMAGGGEGRREIVRQRWGKQKVCEVWEGLRERGGGWEIAVRRWGRGGKSDTGLGGAEGGGMGGRGRRGNVREGG